MLMPLVLTNRRRRGGGASAPAFSPADIFSSGSQGVWYDPSDLTTMFVDRAGTTPVTAPGQLVGLRLDKSKGLVLGAELVTNGDFSDGTTGWMVTSPVTLTVVDGQGFIARNNGAITQFPRQAVISAGTWYEVSFTVVARSNSVSVYMQGTTGLSVFSTSTTGTFTAKLLAGSEDSLGVRIGPTGVGTAQCTLDNISVRELAGNHAVAPTDAARPIYGVEPKGGRRNLLTWSEDFGNAAWVKTRATATVGALTESSESGIHIAIQNFTYAAGDYTLAVDFKPNGRDWIALQAKSSSSYFGLTGAGSLGNVFGTVTSRSITLLPDGYYRCVITVPATAGADNVTIYLASANGTVSYTGNGTSGVLVRNAQLELGSTATNYQRTTTAYDITESGVATCHYVQYDGSDDSMSTAAIDFTATDKMSVFAGVRKLSDAASGTIVELSATTSNGSIGLFGPSGLREYIFLSRGTVTADARIDSATYAAPITNVLTGLGDISGDLVTLRIDGTQVDQATTDQGTGNFGNYAMFFGRRNNATLPFNGKDYGIVIVGKAASAGEITDTETWLAAKTSGVTI